MRKTYIQNGRDLETSKLIASEQQIPLNTVEKPIPCIATPDKSYGSAADTCCTPVPIPGEAKKSAENIDPVAEPSIVPVAEVVMPPPLAVPPERSPVVVGLSPRLEMRLALNNDIMGDEDLICYDPGPDLATILGHDLSTFHRFTGRDLISRSASRVQPKEAYISFSQQKNSKMDTPTPNRKKPSPNTWSNSASVVPGEHIQYLAYISNFNFYRMNTFCSQRKKSNRPRTISETREEVLHVSIEEFSSNTSIYKSNEEYESC